MYKLVNDINYLLIYCFIFFILAVSLLDSMKTNLLCIKGPVQSVWVFEPAAAADDHMRSAEIREQEMKFPSLQIWDVWSDFEINMSQNHLMTSQMTSASPLSIQKFYFKYIFLIRLKYERID